MAGGPISEHRVLPACQERCGLARERHLGPMTHRVHPMVLAVQLPPSHHASDRAGADADRQKLGPADTTALEPRDPGDALLSRARNGHWCTNPQDGYAVCALESGVRMLLHTASGRARGLCMGVRFARVRPPS